VQVVVSVRVHRPPLGAVWGGQVSEARQMLPPDE